MGKNVPKVRANIGSPKKLYKDKAWLFNQYITLNKNAKLIAEECKVDHKVIIEWLDEFEIYKEIKRNTPKK